MEMEIPNAVDPPLAKICGIQFGLLTSDDIYKLSVFETQHPVEKMKELDARLGLPISSGKCRTCDAETIIECEGHFAHCLLPTPIYHPSHVSKLVNLLRKICLNCGNLKRKKTTKVDSWIDPTPKERVPVAIRARSDRLPPMPAVHDNDHYYDDAGLNNACFNEATLNEAGFIDDKDDGFEGGSPVINKWKYAEVFMDMEARGDKGKQAAEPSESVIVLSSSGDEDDDSSSARKPVEADEDIDLHTTPGSSARRSWNFRKRKSPAVSNENSTPRAVIDLTHVEVWNPLSVAKRGKRQRTDMVGGSLGGSRSEVVIVEDVVAPKPQKSQRACCKFCSGQQAEAYPEVLLKIEVKERGKEDSISKAIRMEIKSNDTDMVATDFWSFVEGRSSKTPNHIKKSRLLLPSEALSIVRKIAEADLVRLGMDPEVARPEALIVECVAVPPNCMRIQDDSFGNSNVGFKQGIDRATVLFGKLLAKIAAIKKSRFGRPTFVAASIEASELQSIFGLYLREKGAPKAVPGKEKARTDHVGRVQKRDNRWSLEWLKRHVLGKRSGFCARNVLTGDPFLNVEEIGIPQQVAKFVTIPERVNKLNREKLQQSVNYGQELFGRYRVCAAVRLTRGQERLEVTRKSGHDLAIGDIVHRHLKDGDLVYVNRPPSLHKHSLLALKVNIQESAVFTVNPAICSPLHADFDGDCLHLFVPQSEEATAELHQLMTISAQILPSPDGKAILGMSQDSILATHLTTSSPIFLNIEEMCQMAMWSMRKLPVPTIVKTPGGGPMWAGKQVIDLTIPQDFSYTSKGVGVDIRDGELISYHGKENWLSSTVGLVRVLAQYSAHAAVKHLDCSQSMLREWLLVHGFSVSLRDFYASANYETRRNMIEKLETDLIDLEKMATNKELIFDEKLQKLDAIRLDPDCVLPSQHQDILQDVAVGHFQQQFSWVGESLGSSIGADNQLLAMVRSGSKGSMPKVLQQIRCLGLQLYKGEHLLKIGGKAKLQSIAVTENLGASWVARGLVKSSLLDGLTPLEFYLHAIAVRAGILRQSMEVTEPGELFKNLMLFLRDIHVAYDGSVRNRSREVIQFAHNGSSNSNDPPSAKDSVMPGEAVGILAATAIAQPAYQVMLEANHNVGSKKIRSLALLQETIFPRYSAKLKAADRRIILRLKPCPCDVKHCSERRALKLKNELQPVSIQELARASAIQYVPGGAEEWERCRQQGVKLLLPWVGHIQLDQNIMNQKCVDLDSVLIRLDTAFKTKAYCRSLSSSLLEHPTFFLRNECDCMEGLKPCLHFTASLKSKKKKSSTKKMVDFVDALWVWMIPMILRTTIKGHDRVETAKVTWEDLAWSPARVLSDDGVDRRSNSKGELVVEVTIPEKLSTARGTPWSIVKEVCVMSDIVDWQRSAPHSVQDLRHAFGVEPARACVLQRLVLATNVGGSSVDKKHLELLADRMIQSGDVTGLTPFGYKDLLRSLNTSAPFTAGAFRAPIKTFMEAGEKGDVEDLCGVLASSIFGNRVPVGTGSHFSLTLQPKVTTAKRPVDIFECLAELNSKLGNEGPDKPLAVGVMNGSSSPCAWEVEQAADWEVTGTEKELDCKDSSWGGNGASGGEMGGWGSSPVHSAGEGRSALFSQTPLPAVGEADYWNISGAGGDASGWVSPPPQETCANAGGTQVSTVYVDSGEDWAVNASTEGGRCGWGSQPMPELDGMKPSPVVGPEVGDWGIVGRDTTGWGDCGGHRPSVARQEARKFVPSGANNVPLGKVRTWLRPAGSGPSTKGPSSSTTPSTVISFPKKDGETSWRHHEKTLEEEPYGWGLEKALGSEWTLSSVQEGGRDTDWGVMEVDEFQDDLSSWSSPKVSLSANFRGSSQHSLPDGGRGSLPSRRELSSRTKPDLSLKDTEDWKTVNELTLAVRNILHDSELNAKLEEVEHQLLLTKVLPHHPSFVAKVGVGIEYFKVAISSRATDCRATRCFFVVRSDGSEDDFSYHKCLHTMASKKTPALDALYSLAFQYFKK